MAIKNTETQLKQTDQDPVDIKVKMNNEEEEMPEAQELLNAIDGNSVMAALEETIKNGMKQVYLEGMEVGGQGYLAAIYEMIQQGKAEYQSPEEVLDNIECLCRSTLEIPEDEEETTQVAFVLGEIKGLEGVH